MRFNNSYRRYTNNEEQKREKRRCERRSIEEERVPLSRVKLVHVEKRTAARG